MWLHMFLPLLYFSCKLRARSKILIWFRVDFCTLLHKWCFKIIWKHIISTCLFFFAVSLWRSLCDLIHSFIRSRKIVIFKFYNSIFLYELEYIYKENVPSSTFSKFEAAFVKERQNKCPIHVPDLLDIFKNGIIA